MKGEPVTVAAREMPAEKKEQRRLLLTCAAAYARMSGLPEPNAGQFRLGVHGKPYFADSPVHFSISHSGRYWLCAFAPFPVGLDIQEHSGGRQQKIAARFFHPLECAFLENTGYTAFYDIWAAKESYLKWTGEGLPGGLGSFCVVDCAGEIRGGEDAVLTPLPFTPGNRGLGSPVPGYSVCLCSELPVGEVHWDRG